jgi:hypothetical protein
MGNGLCRTEECSMLGRLPIVVEMILANTEEERSVALNRLLPINGRTSKKYNHDGTTAGNHSST